MSEQNSIFTIPGALATLGGCLCTAFAQADQGFAAGEYLGLLIEEKRSKASAKVQAHSS